MILNIPENIAIIYRRQARKAGVSEKELMICALRMSAPHEATLEDALDMSSASELEWLRAGQQRYGSHIQ